MEGITTLIIVAAVMGGVFILITSLSYLYSLRQIKNKTAGNGQHGTARWASHKEIHQTYKPIAFEPQKWRLDAESRPKEQGIVVGCESKGNATTALVDSGDVHCMMIGAAGVGKTAYWLYPNIEYACATGMSFMTTDKLYSLSIPGMNNGIPLQPNEADISNLLHQKARKIRRKDASWSITFSGVSE